jgi:hypothetical protein
MEPKDKQKKEKKLNAWLVFLEKSRSNIAETLLYFGATRDLKFKTGKLLPFSWVKSLNVVLNKYSNYTLSKCIDKILSPDQEDLTDHAIFAVVGFKREHIESLHDGIFNISKSDARLYRRVGLLFCISEDNQVGLFGVWPNELFLAVKQNPVHTRILESLLLNRPNFWEDVFVMVPLDYDWSSIFTAES